MAYGSYIIEELPLIGLNGQDYGYVQNVKVDWEGDPSYGSALVEAVYLPAWEKGQEWVEITDNASLSGIKQSAQKWIDLHSEHLNWPHTANPNAEHRLGKGDVL